MKTNALQYHEKERGIVSRAGKTGVINISSSGAHRQWVYLNRDVIEKFTQQPI